MTAAAPPLPRLVPDLKLCLASLYGLDVGGGEAQNLPSPKQTHEFLMQLQTRNVRRQLQSIHQQHRDSLQNGNKKNDTNNSNNSSISSSVETVHMGSSWLACLVVLCQSSSSNTERLFCAQTLLHRCRCVKLTEAIDLEMELYADSSDKQLLLQVYEQITMTVSSPTQPETTTTTLPWIPSYLSIVSFVNPLVARVLQDSFQLSLDEERTKAELSILTLATVAYQIASAHSNDTGNTGMQDNSMNAPLLSTTVSALATTAFRLCYTMTNGSTTAAASTNEPSNGPSLLAMLRHVYTLVWRTVSMTTTTTDPALLNGSHGNHSYTALSIAFLCTIASVPDVVLGSPGGARGRLSADPKAIQTASTDLRSLNANSGGAALLLDILMEQQQTAASLSSSSTIDVWILSTCARWATFLPLSLPVLELVLPLLNRYLVAQHEPHRMVAYSFLVAVYESAAWTVDQILSSSLGLSAEQSNGQQASKKKQTSRAKRRQKEKINSSTTYSSLPDAQAELSLRGEIACRTTLHYWPILSGAAHQALSAASVLGSLVQGEGPIGCVAACANACLPHVLRQHLTMARHGCELFVQIADTFQQICASPNVVVRALALEPIFTLHGVLLDVVQTDGPIVDKTLEEIVVNHLFHCLLNLSAVCPYPPGYFDHLCAESFQDLEIERNDIRDLLRTVAGSGEGGSTVDSGSDEYPVEATICILSKMIHSCREAVVHARSRNELCPEVVVHTFSSLAKPMNHLAKCFARQGGTDQVRQCLGSALYVLLEVNQMIVEAFQSVPESILLPLSRTANIGSASYAPFLAAVASLQDAEMSEGLSRLLDVVSHASILSLERLPELPGPSILKHSIYDIRGTMRGPGGEDHVGCLTLMRCAMEDDILTHRMVATCAPYSSRLCDLHQHLKRLEIERGQHIFHGQGVTPQTRRILVGTLCRLEVASQGQLGASPMLTGILNSAIVEIASFRQMPLGEQELFRITETALDLASFTPTIVATLFESTAATQPDHLTCLEVLTTACLQGYEVPSSSPEVLIQWNRLRSALFALLKKSVVSDVSQRASSIIVACVQGECGATHRLCAGGPRSTSNTFVDDVISPESIPAGLFVRAIYEMIRSLPTDRSVPPNCIQVLVTIKKAVLSTTLLRCPEPQYGAFIDPRPTITEAWFHAMSTIAESKPLDESAHLLLVETFAAVVALLFYPSLTKDNDRVNDMGMSLDGPHSLALTSFLTTFFRCGLIQQGSNMAMDTLQPDLDSAGNVLSDRDFRGIALTVVSLFRACQGALPPWAIEAIPDIFSALYEALGENAETFGRAIEAAMAIRLSKSDSFLGVAAGQLLSGRYFEGMSTTAKESFVQEAKELARLGGAANWRRLKGLIKAICGGKKKDTHFKQKPSPYRWEFDRV